VAEVAVIGVHDARWGERPLAIVVLRPGAAPDAGSIQAHVLKRVENGEISKYAVPEKIEFVDIIPKTSVGKLDKKLLRQRHT
jgi:fatty-acyl-CoA synthase